jgi:hypothetical protein
MNSPAQKFAARKLIAKAKRDGILIPQKCKLCGAKDSGDNRANSAHHPNYDKPAEIVWLCDSCHSALHNDQLPANDAIVLWHEMFRLLFPSKTPPEISPA